MIYLFKLVLELQIVMSEPEGAKCIFGQNEICVPK